MDREEDAILLRYKPPFCCNTKQCVLEKNSSFVVTYEQRRSHFGYNTSILGFVFQMQQNDCSDVSFPQFLCVLHIIVRLFAIVYSSLYIASVDWTPVWIGIGVGVPVLVVIVVVICCVKR